MAWSSLASNQMVSYTEAQGGGFTLQSGQSHVTSNECMTKSEAFAKYILNATTASGFDNNELLAKSGWASGVVGNSFSFGTVDSGSSAGACSGPNTGRTLYSSSSTLSVGTHLYTDSLLTNSFIPGDGTQSYYLHSGSNSYRVTQLGIINLITACVTSYSFNFSISSTFDEPEACGFSYGQTLYSASSSLNISTILYTDSGLVNIFNGQSKFWLGGGTPYRINAAGTIYIIGETCN